ncbi:unnamed protein product [Caenorhabditis sp. 36 PRJEB53466]|nr:unnamed protein product [Caenorhabditis sp. 36 PRJEB53466]
MRSTITKILLNKKEKELAESTIFADWLTMTARPTSLSDAGIQLAPDENHSESTESLATETPLNTSSSLAECDDATRARTRMEKYFAEKPDKNIFMKLIHPSYHERNLQFKKIFVDKGLIDETDQFLASYSCAYQREILAQGRMFISQFNVCFYANIIGWETTLVIPMREIKVIKKMKAAFIFPNSIQFEQEGRSEKYFFASFINRDKSFQVLTTAHQKVLGATDGKAAMTREEVWDMVYNSEEKNPQTHTPPETGTPPSGSATNNSIENITAPISSPSTMQKSSDKDTSSLQSSASSSDDSEHQQDEQFEEVPCPCTDHVGRLLLDLELPISVEKFYELLFVEGDFQTEFNARMRVGEYVAATWVRDHRGENTRTCHYTVSLSHAMAPRAIVVNEKQVLHAFPNPRHGIMLSKETQNSGVPYADYFTVNCRYCISRRGANACRVKVHGGLVYCKALWSVIRTFVEKGTYGGLEDHFSCLSTMLEEYVQKHPNIEDRTTTTCSIPVLQEIPKTEENEIRLRNVQKSSPERLLAGGEANSKMTCLENVNDENIIARRVAELSSSTAADLTAGYRPYLLCIIVLLAIFLLANLWILSGFKGETNTAVASKREENLGEMMSVLLEQVRELKDKVEQLQKDR